jgi:multidrug efflux pump subunit AcrA (membrane-fusion protein)
MKEFSHLLDEKKKMSKKKKIIVWSIVTLVVLLIIMRIGQSKKNKKQPQLSSQNSAVPVQVEKATREKVIDSIETNGDIEGIKKAYIYTDYPGKIVRVAVKEGQRVKPGQTLAWMNRDIVVKRFSDYPIKTLIGGIVGEIFLKTGETVTPASPVMTVEETSQVKCIARIVEKKLSEVRVGQKALLKVDAYPKQIFEGTVKEISPVLDPMSRTAEVTIVIPNYKYSKTPLKPGMFASAKIQIRTLENALLVPYSSVLKDDEGKFYLFKYQEGISRKIYVKTGILKYYDLDEQSTLEATIPARIVIKDANNSLKEGDFVVYMGHQFLNEGEQIRFTYKGKQYGPKKDEVAVPKEEQKKVEKGKKSQGETK